MTSAMPGSLERLVAAVGGVPRSAVRKALDQFVATYAKSGKSAANDDDAPMRDLLDEDAAQAEIDGFRAYCNGDLLEWIDNGPDDGLAAANRAIVAHLSGDPALAGGDLSGFAAGV